MDQAVDLGLVRSPLLKAAMAEVEAQVARVYQAASGWRPQVRLEYVAMRYQQPLGVPFTTAILGRSQTIQAAPFSLSQFEAHLGIRQVISDGGRVGQLVAQALATARGSYAQLLRAVQEYRFQVETAYLGVLEAQAVLDVAEEALRSAREHLALADASFKAGVTARADITFARTPVARAETQVASARNAVRVARTQLSRLIGADPSSVVPIVGQSTLQPPTLSLDEARHAAQAARPDLLARHEEGKAWTAAGEAAKKQRSLRIEAVGSERELGYGTSEVIPPHTGWSLSLELSYPLFDGGLSRYQEEEARARARAAESRADDLSRDVDAQVVEAWLRLENARERLTLDDAQVADAKEALAVARGQYAAGVAPILNVLDAEVSLVRAQADQVRSGYEVQRSLARLQLAIGQ